MFSSQRLRALRKEKKMSLEKLGSLLNVSRVAVSNWETGRSTPTESNLKQLASVMGVSEDYFIENSEITSIYSQLNQANKDKIVALSAELLDEQSGTANGNTSELYSYKRPMRAFQLEQATPTLAMEITPSPTPLKTSPTILPPGLLVIPWNQTCQTVMWY